jgi:membrane protease YdiL (CAAX protease family)
MIAFFALVLVLSIPLWVIGALKPVAILPGLPLGSLAVIVPLIAALILVYRETGTAGPAELLKRAFDFKRISAGVWYLPIFLLMPGLLVLSWVALRLTGTAVPAPQFTIPSALALFIVCLIAGLGEELGWSGYAIDPMQARSGALLAALLLGVVWALWHAVLLVQAGRSAGWIAWWCLGTVAQRVLLVWLYNNTGKSVFAAAVAHATANLAWQLFPIQGSYYDPRVTGLITAAAAVIVALIWGPATLARLRSS